MVETWFEQPPRTTQRKSTQLVSQEEPNENQRSERTENNPTKINATGEPTLTVDANAKRNCQAATDNNPISINAASEPTTTQRKSTPPISIINIIIAMMTMVMMMIMMITMIMMVALLMNDDGDGDADEPFFRRRKIFRPLKSVQPDSQRPRGRQRLTCPCCTSLNCSRRCSPPHSSHIRHRLAPPRACRSSAQPSTASLL